MASIIVVAFVDVAFVSRSKFVVVVVISVVCIVRINGIVGSKQRRWACVCLGFSISVDFSTTCLACAFYGIVTEVGAVAGAVFIAIDLVHVSSKSIERSVGLYRVEMKCVVLNVEVQGL